MYTVGREEFPDLESATATASDFAAMLEEIKGIENCIGLHFVGEVYTDNLGNDRFSVVCYSGRIANLSLVEPPSFNLLVDEAMQKLGECTCPSLDVDLVFENYGQAMIEAQIAQDCDDFACAPTQDPHYVDLSLPLNSEVTIRFDRLGAFGVNGILDSRGMSL